MILAYNDAIGLTAAFNLNLLGRIMARNDVVRALVPALGLALAAVSASALDTSKLKPTGFVNDFAHVLDSASAATLEAYCGNLERATGAQ